MDYLHARQDTIQDALAARHLAGGTLVLYDVSSAAFEGRTCPLGAIGHPKDGVRGRLQIVYGLLTSKDGIPVAIEVFAGNTGDPTTVAAQVTKVKDRFGITKVVLVGDRGMLTAARLREDVRPADLDWITALRAPQVKALVRGRGPAADPVRCPGPGRDHLPGLPRRAAGGLHEPVPGSRAGPQARKPAGRHRGRPGARSPRPARGPGGRCAARTRSPCASDRVLNRRKVAKHFTIEITDDSFSYARNQDSITAEAALDGIYVLRTSVAASDLDSRRGRLLLQGPGPGRAGLPRLQYRPGHPAHPAPHRGPGPRARVLADAVVLHHLAHAGPARARCCSPTTTSPPPRPPGPARSPPPPAPRAPWPRPPPSRPPATSRCTASPPCSPTWPPSA